MYVCRVRKHRHAATKPFCRFPKMLHGSGLPSLCKCYSGRGASSTECVKQSTEVLALPERMWWMNWIPSTTPFCMAEFGGHALLLTPPSRGHLASNWKQYCTAAVLYCFTRTVQLALRTQPPVWQRVRASSCTACCTDANCPREQLFCVAGRVLRHAFAYLSSYLYVYPAIGLFGVSISCTLKMWIAGILWQLAVCVFDLGISN